MPKVKIGKLVTVAFLTVLIWIWADLALEETYSLSKVPIVIGKSNDQTLWVNFVNPDGSLGTTSKVETVVLKGPASKLRQVKQQYEEGSLDLKLLLVPPQWETVKRGDQAIAVVDIIEQNPKIRQWGLTVESCSPETFTVRIDRLIKIPLKIRCIDPNNMTINGAVVEPDKVDMYVPADWGIEKQVADVQLTAEQVARAKTGPIKKRPYILLAPGQRQEAQEDVTIRTLPGPNLLKTFPITNVRPGILLSETLQARYQVKVDNPQDLYSSFEIRATEQAKQAYEDEKNTRYQVILEIDTESTELQEKDLIYNFPQKYLRSNEIESIRLPAKIHFRLVPRPAPESGTVVAP